MAAKLLCSTFNHSAKHYVHAEIANGAGSTNGRTMLDSVTRATNIRTQLT
jgi:hypothetical protein